MFLHFIVNSHLEYLPEGHCPH